MSIWLRLLLMASTVLWFCCGTAVLIGSVYVLFFLDPAQAPDSMNSASPLSHKFGHLAVVVAIFAFGLVANLTAWARALRRPTSP